MAAITSPPPTRSVPGHPSTPGVVRAELYKAGRRLRTYVAYGIVAAIPIIITFVLKANPPDGRDGPFLAFLGSQSGLLIPAFALRITSEFLLVVVVALFAGDAIAGEASWGNLRYLLMRPIGRGRLFAAKFIVSVVYAWIAVGIVVVVGAIVGGTVFGFHGISFGVGPFGLSESASSIVGHLAIATVYVSWFLTTIIAFSFMLGCMTDSPGGAILGGIGLWITFAILDAIDSLGQIRYFFPTHWSGAWVDMFTRNSVSDDMIRGALLTLGYVIVFLGIAAWWFRRKDILS
jgi:ABC-2 type transport system permease protein